ncbi:MAG TPA: hypothetical protein VF530_14040 [Planctomycetota bacterium]
MPSSPVVVLGLLSLAGLHGSGPRDLDAYGILLRSERVYAECRTYRDTGAVKTVYIKDGKRRTVTKPFSTAFVRPDRFRYEFLDRRGDEEFDRYLIWSEARDVKTWWDIRPGVETESTLERALGAARGVSGASSYTIAELLMDFPAGFERVTDLSDAVRQGEEDLGGIRCFVVTGGSREEPVTLWIDQSTFLLRRIDEQNVFPDFRTEETTTYDPVIDEAIPESLLAFDPPVAETPASRPPRARHRWGPDELDALDAQHILERTTRTYAECRTYRDSAVARTWIADEGGRPRTERAPFTTAFVRPDRFRLEARARRGEEEFDRCLAWRNGEDVRSWWDLRPGVQHVQMGAALSPATLMTSFTVDTVPALLGEVSGRSVTKMTDPERMEDEEVDGRACFVLESRFDSLTLWIDQESFLLLKLERFFGPRETTVTYEPAIDLEIAESELVFDPPDPEPR